MYVDLLHQRLVKRFTRVESCVINTDGADALLFRPVDQRLGINRAGQVIVQVAALGHLAQKRLEQQRLIPDGREPPCRAATSDYNGEVTAVANSLAARPVSGTVLRANGLFSVRETCGLGVCGTCTARIFIECTPTLPDGTRRVP